MESISVPEPPKADDGKTYVLIRENDKMKWIPIATASIGKGFSGGPKNPPDDSEWQILFIPVGKPD